MLNNDSQYVQSDYKSLNSDLLNVINIQQKEILQLTKQKFESKSELKDLIENFKLTEQQRIDQGLLIEKMQAEIEYLRSKLLKDEEKDSSNKKNDNPFKNNLKSTISKDKSPISKTSDKSKQFSKQKSTLKVKVKKNTK